MTTLNYEEIEAVRREHKNVPHGPVNGRFPVITLATDRLSGIETVGVQFWTNEEIFSLTRKDGDGSTSIFLSQLYT